MLHADHALGHHHGCRRREVTKVTSAETTTVMVTQGVVMRAAWRPEALSTRGWKWTIGHGRVFRRRPPMVFGCGRPGIQGWRRASRGLPPRPDVDRRPDRPWGSERPLCRSNARAQAR